jgi:chaperone required for assembly of F1-ATPase
VPQYQIYLDGRLLRTPARNQMQFPNKEMAMAVAMEWDAQTDRKKGIQPATMPMMTLVATAIDQIAPGIYKSKRSWSGCCNVATIFCVIDPTHVRNTVLSYFPTDTSLFWTTTSDRILLKKQRQHFEPVLRCECIHFS